MICEKVVILTKWCVVEKYKSLLKHVITNDPISCDFFFGEHVLFGRIFCGTGLVEENCCLMGFFSYELQSIYWADW